MCLDEYVLSLRRRGGFAEVRREENKRWKEIDWERKKETERF
jgi:hypothetical protein